MRTRSEFQMRRDREYEIEIQYMQEIGHMNRAERRTEKGKRLVAEAKLRAAEARLKMLQEDD